MSKTPNVKTFVRQKKMGRPVTVEGENKIAVRLSDRQLDAVDAWALANNVSRSEAIRRLIKRGLPASGGKAHQRTKP